MKKFKNKVRIEGIEKFLLTLALLTPLAEAEKIDFAQTIRPILNTHCVACHGGVTDEGGVSFIYREQVLAIADSGNATVVPGKPEQSELMYRITTEDADDRMPQPDHGERLSEHDIGLIRQWILEGAEWSNHWSFEKPTAHTTPPVEDETWPQNKIDFFALAKMEQADLSPAPTAKPSTLLRRLSLDITGLPPTLEQLDSFDGSDAAATIERLLAAPEFGEKWASMWLDASRYSDSEGLGMDRARTVWPYRDWVVRAFNSDLPYQEFLRKQIAGDLLPEPTLDDLVATTFNRLTQSNQEGGTDNEEFRVAAVMDRLATTWESFHGLTFACAQCHDHPYEPIRQDDYYRFMAFFNNTRDLDYGNHAPVLKVPLDHARYPEMNALRRAYEESLSEFNQRSSTTADAIKWQPVPELELTSTATASEVVPVDGFAEIRTVGTISYGAEFDITLPKPEGFSTLTAIRIDILPTDIAKAAHSGELGAVLSGIELSYLAPGDGEETPVKLTRVIPDEPLPLVDPNLSLNLESEKGWGPRTHQYRPRHCTVVLDTPLPMTAGSHLRLKIDQSGRAINGPLCAKRLRLSLSDTTVLHELLQSPAMLQLEKVAQETGQQIRNEPGVTLPIMAELPANLRRETRPFARGNWLEKEDRILAPGTPESLHPLSYRGDEATRLDLANWLAAPENPLVARVLVNRVWHQLFGLGLVETLEDFGSSGLMPSHPELLDDLAVRFQTEMNWSIKTLIREITLSATYQQSAAHPKSREHDRPNQLLARGPRNRLAAEAVRDHHLAASGLLTKQVGGKPVYPPLPPGVWTPFKNSDQWPTNNPQDPNRYRRSLYTYYKRSIPFPLFATFDAPTRDICSQRRLRSNTPLAALAMLNDVAFVEMAQALADRVQAENPGDELAERLALAYRYATSQKAEPEVVAELLSLHQAALERYRDNSELLAEGNVPAEQAALAVVTNIILNLDASLTK